MKNKTESESSIYERAGRATFLPGLLFAIELLESKRDELQAYLDGSKAPPPEKRKYTRSEAGQRVRTYWTSLTPEQRTAEMKRRANVIKERAKARIAAETTGSTPKVVFVPPTPEPAAPAKREGHAAGGTSKWWASLTEEQKLAHKKKMSIGLKKGFAKKKKLAAQLVNGAAKGVTKGGARV